MKIRIFRRDLIMMMKIWEHVIPSVKNDRICDDIAKWRCHHCVTVQMFQVSFETFHENVISWLTKISTMIPEILFMKWYFMKWRRRKALSVSCPCLVSSGFPGKSCPLSVYCLDSAWIFDRCLSVGIHRAKFLKIDRGVQKLHISAHEMAPMCAFSILQKWPKIAKMTPGDFLTLIMVSSEPPGKTEQKTLLVF